MVKAESFFNELTKNDIGEFIEVPCSILKPLLNYMFDRDITVETPVNEAVAMGIAAGSYMATGKIPAVMIQNSGFCNTINALTSLNQIYQIPVLYIITWRGFGGKGKDAPEHDVMGEKIENLLKCLDVPYEILDSEKFREQIKKMVEKARRTEKPTCLLMKKDFLDPYEPVSSREITYPLSRFDAIKIIKENSADSLIISSNGFPSRDSFAAKETRDFYMMGSMGHALPIGIGVASHTKRKVIVLDGDGSILMHLGAMASVGAKKPRNLIHVVLDNGVYDSTGAQPTLSHVVNFVKLAESLGYRKAMKVKTPRELRSAIKFSMKNNGPSLIQVLINTEKNRPKRRVSDVYSCSEVKNMFMEEIMRV